jgi:hypothetical protein
MNEICKKLQITESEFQEYTHAHKAAMKALFIVEALILNGHF